MKIQESGEMYLETILVLSKKLPQVRSLDVANELQYSKPSVSRAMSILKENNFIKIDDNGFITLTKKGSNLANKIYERHMILTELFVSLGVEKEIAENDACRIEHDLSDETFNAIRNKLKK